MKNTLTRFAAKQIGFDELDAVLNGPTSLALSFEDAVAPAKIIADFAKDHEALEIKAGFLDGKVISIDEINTLGENPVQGRFNRQNHGQLKLPHFQPCAPFRRHCHQRGGFGACCLSCEKRWRCAGRGSSCSRRSAC